MNASKREQKRENPWQSVQALSKKNAVAFALSVVLYLVCSVAIPLAFYSRVAAIVAVLVALAGAFYLSRRALRSVSILGVLTVGGFFLFQSFLITNDGYRLVIALSSLVAVVCVGIMAGAFFQTVAKAYWLSPLLSAAAAAIVFGITKNPIFSVSALLLCLPSLLLTIATRKGAYRSTAILCSAIGLLIGIVGLALLWIWRVSGACSLEAIREAINAIQSETVEMGIALRNAYLDEMRAMIEKNAHWNAEQVEYANSLMNQISAIYADDVLINAVAKCFNLLPAMLFVLCAIPTFLSQAMLNGAYASNGLRGVLTPESEFFTMSVTAAVLYLISTFVTLCFMSSLSIAVTVADNLCLCLMPGFLLLSVRGFKTAFGKTRGFGRVLLILSIVLAVSCFSVAALPVLALYGAYLRIFAAAKQRMSNGNGPHFN